MQGGEGKLFEDAAKARNGERSKEAKKQSVYTTAKVTHHRVRKVQLVGSFLFKTPLLNYRAIVRFCCL